MIFQSILFGDMSGRPACAPAAAPEFFADLNLDQIVAAITAGKEEYDLTPFFHAPLGDGDAIAFRHEVFHDLEEARLVGDIKAFAETMRAVREHLAQAEKIRHPHQKTRWFLDAVRLYCDGVSRLAADLAAADLRSRGLSAFREYVSRYTGAAPFTSLAEQTKQLAAELSAAVYGVLIDGPRVDVRLHAGEPDYSAEVLAAFARFRQGPTQHYKFDFSDPADVNHIEGQVLNRVALLYHDTFTKLIEYYANNKKFADPTIVAFDREIQFYLAYGDYIARFKKLRLRFCYPNLSEARNEIFDYQGFDLALAGKLADEHAVPVCNDFHLRGPERMIVVSGPNQGGKTTFARAFGQLHYLAGLGCPVPGAKAQLHVFDAMFTHFEREENIADLRGKLQDDLVRIHRILDAATPRSIIVMNEIFGSTTLRDAVVLGKKIAAAMMRLDLYCVWVTFIDELASLGEQTVSMVSTVVPENPALRTYKILRQPADGLAYAMSIAEQHRLTGDMIKQRLGR